VAVATSSGVKAT